MTCFQNPSRKSMEHQLNKIVVVFVEMVNSVALQDGKKESLVKLVQELRRQSCMVAIWALFKRLKDQKTYSSPTISYFIPKNSHCCSHNRRSTARNGMSVTVTSSERVFQHRLTQALVRSILSPVFSKNKKNLLAKRWGHQISFLTRFLHQSCLIG